MLWGTRAAGWLEHGLHNLPVHPIARHSRLGSPAVAAHLQADQAPTLAELFLAELPTISLGFPVRAQHTQSEEEEPEASRTCCDH